MLGRYQLIRGFKSHDATSFDPVVPPLTSWRPGTPENGVNHFRFSGHWSWFADDPTCRPYIWLSVYRAVRETPKGRWLQSEYGDEPERLILTTARKKWAYPTRAEAWESFRIRQKRRLQHAENQLEGVTQLCALMNEDQT